MRPGSAALHRRPENNPALTMSAASIDWTDTSRQIVSTLLQGSKDKAPGPNKQVSPLLLDIRAKACKPTKIVAAHTSRALRASLMIGFPRKKNQRTTG